MSDVDYRVPLVLEATDMRDLLEERLGPPARNRRFLCPFHDDTNPDLSVKDARFRCFSCGENGSAIDFLRKLDGMTFFEALETLERRAGLNPALVGPAVKRELNRRSLDRIRERNRRNERWIHLVRTRDNLQAGIKEAAQVMQAEVARRYMEVAYDRVCDIEREMATFYEAGEA